MRIKILSELIDEEVIGKVAEALSEVYGYEVMIDFSEEIVDERFLNSRRMQYDAWAVVKEYQALRDEDQYLLLVTVKDLYAAGLNYVFGLAWRGVAIISAYRLRQEFYGEEPDRNLFIERLIKEAVHEIGHLLGLAHCDDRRCVMAFSNWIGDTDYKSWRPCRRCLSKLGISP